MKAITLLPLYAALMMIKFKKIETRSFQPRCIQPGELFAIHAGRQFTSPEYRIYANDYVMDGLRREGMPSTDHLPTSAIVGIVQLVKVETVESALLKIKQWEQIFGDYRPGRYAWHVELVQRFVEPIPAIGKQGLWNWQPPAHVPVYANRPVQMSLF
jgi:hypothetical protein